MSVFTGSGKPIVIDCTVRNLPFSLRYRAAYPPQGPVPCVRPAERSDYEGVIGDQRRRVIHPH